MLKQIDKFFFGSVEEQEGTNKLEKLYFYLPLTISAAVALYIYVNVVL